MRKQIFEIIEPANRENKFSKIYDIGMIITITLSLLPLAFKQDILLFNIIDKVAVIIFIIDYFLRWLTADYLFEKRSFLSFLKYPFTVMAIIDLISILPSLTILNNGVKVLRIFRMIRAMKVFRIFKTMRYSKSIQIISRVISSSRDSLVAVCILAAGYILISALIIFNVEPDTFDTFFDAIVVSPAKDGKLIASDALAPHGGSGHDDPFAEPVPIPFIKIAPGVRLRFRFNLVPTKDADGNVVMSAKDKETLFKNMLTTFGIGAKTNVGYGQLRAVKQ